MPTTNVKTVDVIPTCPMCGAQHEAGSKAVVPLEALRIDATTGRLIKPIDCDDWQDAGTESVYVCLACGHESGYLRDFIPDEWAEAENQL